MVAHSRIVVVGASAGGFEAVRAPGARLAARHRSLFTTAAKEAGSRTAGVMLSGPLSDGIIGLHVCHVGQPFAAESKSPWKSRRRS